MLRSAASDLGLRCLPLSDKKDARLKWVKLPIVIIFFVYYLVAVLHRFYCTIYKDDIFHFYSNSNRPFFEQTVETLIRRRCISYKDDIFLLTTDKSV